VAKNDIVLVDALLKGRSVGTTSRDPGEVFERLVIEEVLKNLDLSGDEIESGWIDGAHDGGIDAFYTLVNGRPLVDPADFVWPKSSAEIRVFLFTCKLRDSFLQAPLDAVLATVQEVFDLSIPTSALRGKYNEELRRSRDAFRTAFEQVSLQRPVISFEFIYACRGDTEFLGESVAARGKQVAELLQSYFSASTATFKAIGAAELVDLHRQVRSFALDLPIQESLTAGDDGYVVLARLTDYCKFVSDEEGRLRRYLFDSNVRAFLGNNLVNRDIAQTLRDRTSPNFWWLNNGVTILVTDASLVGKTLRMKDIQIVNGLQTTESLHRNFRLATEDDERRTLLVKVIVSNDERIRDRVIRATNNQTAVETSALRGTDRIQQDIEEVLLTSDWYYERRTNYYRNEGRPDTRILSPLLMATASVALLMKNPAASSKLKEKRVRATGAYEAIFSDHYPLKAWPNAAALVRGAELAIGRFSRSDHLATWRGPLAFVAAVRLLGTFGYSLQQLADIKQSQVTDALLDESWALVRSAIKGAMSGRVTDAKMHRISERMADTWAPAGHPSDGRRPLPEGLPTQPSAKPSTRFAGNEELLSAVSAALPRQPWPPGVHVTVASALGLQPKKVSIAIQELIRRGAWLQQRDGVVYDANGAEVARDLERAPRPPV